MPLQFINQTVGPDPGPADRRLIRSHVMKGKNAGRPRPSRKKPRKIAPIKRVLRYLPATSTCLDLDAPYRLYTKEPLWHDLALISFPQQLDLESQGLIHMWFLVVRDLLFSPGLCNNSPASMMDSAWVTYTFSDEAYFHCILAIAASYSDWFLGSPRVSRMAVDRISRAYHLINQTLSGPDSVSDRAIAVVTMLAIYQRLHQEQSTGLIHFEGLQRMIHLRGGIGKLMKENRVLAAKPLRLDVEFALEDGSPTHFPSQQVRLLTRSNNFQISCGNAYPTESAETEDPFHGLGLKLQLIKADVLSFARLLNTRQEATKLDPAEYTETVLSILHRLVNFAPLGSPRPDAPLDNLVHLCLTALLATLLPRYGYGQSGYRLLSAHLTSAIHSFETREAQSGKIMLWAIFTVYLLKTGDKDYPFLLPSLEKTCRYLNLHCWDKARQVLEQCFWIHAVHDDQGSALWQAMRSFD